MAEKEKDLITSTLGRLFKLGSVATRVGVSLAAEQARGMVFADPFAQARKTENFVLNAMRVTEALGELKGAAMKVGQMLSVHEGLLPPEVSAVLRGLQKDAPRVAFPVMQRVIHTELPNFDQLFESIDPEPIAAASIGQVYRGRLTDGREVAVKVQYPDIDKTVAADLKNLKKLFGALVAMFAEVEFDEIWEELKARLLEELDYRQEARNMARMAELHADVPEVLVPGVVAEASTRRVLTMDYLPGLTADEACSGRFGQPLRNTWGKNLMAFVLRGLLVHRFLHADPNMANYAFLEDGRLIVYDHGCMKEVDVALAANYRRALEALVDGRPEALPDILFDMGIYRRHLNKPVSPAMLEPIAAVSLEILGDRPYRFSPETDVYDIILDMKTQHLSELTDVALPRDMVFINRALSGLFGNLCRLEAEACWREVAQAYTHTAGKA